MSRCIFINGNGQSGEPILDRCLQLLGLTPAPLSAEAFNGMIPNGRPAWEVEGYHPAEHVLTGIHWPGTIEKRKMRDEILRPHVRTAVFTSGQLLHNMAAHDLIRDLNMRMIVLTRDPRDWAWTAAQRLATLADPLPFNRPHGYPLELHLADFVFGFGAPQEGVGRLPMVTHYRLLHRWSEHRDICLTVRVEDLVGSSRTRCETVKMVADFVGIPYREDVPDELHRMIQTRPERQVGSWREQWGFFCRTDVAERCSEAADIAGYGFNARRFGNVLRNLGTAGRGSRVSA